MDERLLVAGKSTDATSAELIGLYLTIEWAKENGWINSVLLTDSKIAADGINKHNKYLNSHSNLIHSCREALQVQSCNANTPAERT